MYSLHLNWTYSNYTEAAAKSSAAQQHSTLIYKYPTNCTVCNWILLTAITQYLLLHVQLHNSAQHVYFTNTLQTVEFATELYLQQYTQKLLLHVQLHNGTAHLLCKYCTNSTLCNWTVLTVITQKLLLHVQLHNGTAHLLCKYCTNCTFCNGNVLTVITQNLPLHVQLHNSTAHLLYKYCTSCTFCNWTVLTVITQKLLLHIQLHNTENVQLVSSEVQCSRLFDITSTYTDIHTQ